MTKTQTRMISWAGTIMQSSHLLCVSHFHLHQRVNHSYSYRVCFLCLLIWFFHLLVILYHTPSPHRTKVDLGIVKKSIVVDDVSEMLFYLIHNEIKYMFN